MARRSDHTRDELKEMAITAGLAIVVSHGLGKFSARKVAKEIGYTIGTIYNIFENHDDLILHINAATLDNMYGYIAQNADDGSQCDKAIKELAGSYIKFANENYNCWSALFEFSLPQDVALPDWYLDKVKRLFLLVEVPLSQLDRPHHHAKILWAGIHGICQLGLTGKLDLVDSEPVESLTDSLIDNYLLGVG